MIQINRRRQKPVRTGDLLLIALADKVAIGYNQATGEFGFLVKYRNGTGAATVKGTVVSTSTSANNEFVPQANRYDAVGVVAVGGVENGSDCWLWRHGSVCQVLFENSVAAVRGYLAICSATDGRATNIDVPAVSPVEAEHFMELGHVAESHAGGTDVLILIHFHTL